MHDTLYQFNLSHIYFLDNPAAIHGSRLIISRVTKDAGPNELMNPEILMKNHHKNIHSFALILPAIFPDTDISSCVCIVLLFETSSSSHVQYHIARQRGPLDPEPAIGPCRTASEHEICHVYIKHATLFHIDLSHMDFLDDPAAIQWSRLIISRATQDEGPNELTNPEILMINHHKYTHCLALILPAIFPDTDIASCICIVLVFETNSSNHLDHWGTPSQRWRGCEALSSMWCTWKIW